MRLSDLTWMELDALVKTGPPILLPPSGSLEQHGPHLPLGSDTVLPLTVAVAVAELISARVGPPLPCNYKSRPKSDGAIPFPAVPA